MKTKVLLFAVLMLVIGTTTASAQAAEYPDELTYYDAQIDVLLPYLDAYQIDYYTVNGMFYQSLESHAAAPDAPLPPDGLSNAPSDQDANLAYFWDAAALPDALAWSFKIDTYSGPDGDGYVLTVITDLDGNLWTRAINYGPDDWRSYDWYQIVPFNEF